MNFKKTILASIIILSPLSAQALDFGVGIKGGTAGVGVDLSMTMTDTLNLRLSSTSYDFDGGSETFDLDSGDGQNIASFTSDFNVDFGATGILVDWYVFDGTFHVSAGMMKNNSSVNIDGTLNSTTVTFGGESYNVSNDFENNSLTGKISFGDSYEPYVGIGWGRKASRDSGLSLSVELGVMLLSPSVTLTAPQLKLNDNTTTVVYTQADQDQLNADVQSAESDANDELSNLEMWPVISVGLNYAF